MKILESSDLDAIRNLSVHATEEWIQKKAKLKLKRIVHSLPLCRELIQLFESGHEFLVKDFDLSVRRTELFSKCTQVEEALSSGYLFDSEDHHLKSVELILAVCRQASVPVSDNGVILTLNEIRAKESDGEQDTLERQILDTKSLRLFEEFKNPEWFVTVDGTLLGDVLRETYIMNTQSHLKYTKEDLQSMIDSGNNVCDAMIEVELEHEKGKIDALHSKVSELHSMFDEYRHKPDCMDQIAALAPIGSRSLRQLLYSLYKKFPSQTAENALKATIKHEFKLLKDDMDFQGMIDLHEEFKEDFPEEVNPIKVFQHAMKKQLEKCSNEENAFDECIEITNAMNVERLSPERRKELNDLNGKLSVRKLCSLYFNVSGNEKASCKDELLDHYSGLEVRPINSKETQKRIGANSILHPKYKLEKTEFESRLMDRLNNLSKYDLFVRPGKMHDWLLDFQFAIELGVSLSFNLTSFYINLMRYFDRPYPSPVGFSDISDDIRLLQSKQDSLNHDLDSVASHINRILLERSSILFQEYEKLRNSEDKQSEALESARLQLSETVNAVSDRQSLQTKWIMASGDIALLTVIKPDDLDIETFRKYAPTKEERQKYFQETNVLGSWGPLTICWPWRAYDPSKNEKSKYLFRASDFSGPGAEEAAREATNICNESSASRLSFHFSLVFLLLFLY